MGQSTSRPSAGALQTGCSRGPGRLPGAPLQHQYPEQQPAAAWPRPHRRAAVDAGALADCNQPPNHVLAGAVLGKQAGGAAGRGASGSRQVGRPLQMQPASLPSLPRPVDAGQPTTPLARPGPWSSPAGGPRTRRACRGVSGCRRTPAQWRGAGSASGPGWSPAAAEQRGGGAW